MVNIIDREPTKQTLSSNSPTGWYNLNGDQRKAVEMFVKWLRAGKKGSCTFHIRDNGNVAKQAEMKTFPLI